MYYMLYLKKSLDLHPKFFSGKLREEIHRKLIEDVEGTCSCRYGFIVCVSSLKSIGQGKIRMDSTGYATFNIEYECIVFRPYRGEVVDTIVTSVTQMGFFAECGPCTIFVSSALIPDDFNYQSTDIPMFLSGDEEVRIQQGSEVRLRIIGVKAESHEMFCIGTIKDDYLGVIGNPV
eukprot:TRINITY_DN11190_c0_g2_i3.p2 TRINITY_DN11190_c0_g2~~TRINITY_DN11190_c0_g2_i3.p2  ORF type:complete len:176 (+),score=8.17 TRINITY_DN11190_c0_g2_i3:58-585(+)